MAERNYRKEHDNYQAKPEQLVRNAARKAARRKLEKIGKVKKFDGKDVAHSNGNPTDNKTSNLRVQTKTQNRSYARTKTARKVNPKD